MTRTLRKAEIYHGSPCPRCRSTERYACNRQCRSCNIVGSALCKGDQSKRKSEAEFIVDGLRLLDEKARHRARKVRLRPGDPVAIKLGSYFGS